jgi:TonB-dependent starch-binding outer membrane protein SusC
MRAIWTHIAVAAVLVTAATAAYSQQPVGGRGIDEGRASELAPLDRRARLTVRDVSLETALARLYQSSGVSVSFSPSRLPARLRVSCYCDNVTVRRALETLLQNTSFSFREIEDGYILIVDRPPPPKEAVATPGSKVAARPYPAVEQASEVRLASAPPPISTGTVAGTVTGQDGKPLAGAQVFIQGAAGRTVTDADGRFVAGAVTAGSQSLRASFPGYAEARRTVTVVPGPVTNVSLSLTPLPVELEGVVAVGYGTARRRDLTGAVGSVSTSQMPLGTTRSVGEMLQGRVAGLQVTQNNGAPGGAATLRIRGTSSISAGTEPLYVIDGVPAFAISRMNDASANPLAAINPSDIESVEVLKDASSTAIYGARGAPGVVLVTTKRGSRGVDQFSLESSYGIQAPSKYLAMLNGPEFAAMIRDARANAGASLVSPLTGGSFSQTEFDSIATAGPGTDWQRLVLRRAPMQSHSLSFSGGDTRTRYLVSGSYFDQRGIVLGSGFRRFAGRVNFDRTITARLQVGTNLTISNVDQEVQQTDNGLNSGAVMSALWFNPLVGPRLDDGSWRLISPVTWPATNPLPSAIDDRNWGTAFTVVGNAFGELTFMKAARLRSSLGIATSHVRSEAFARSTSPAGRSANGRASVSSTKAVNLTNENILTYQHATAAGSLDFTGGFTAQTSRTQGLEASNEQFVNDLTGAWDLASGTRPNGDSDYSDWALLSYLGRVAYGLRERYLFTVTGRADGSSRFGRNNKWGFFPSAAFAWRVIDEPFMDRQSVFDELKLRLSYGVTGNQEIGLYQSLPRLTTVPATWAGAPVVGYATESAAPNANLKWETTRQYNGGLDFALLTGRLSGAIDAYRSVTNELLLAVRLPTTSGFATQLRNVGSVRNDGVELSVRTINYDGEAFGWSSMLTVAHNRNRVVALGGARALPVANQKGINSQTGSDVLKMIVGQPLGAFVGKRTDGLYQQGDPCPLRVMRPTIDCVPGEYRYVDTNGDGAIGDSDNVVLGNGQPSLYGGLANNLSTGPFELNAFFQFSRGAEVLNLAAVNMKQVNTFSNNTRDALRRWTPTNTNTDVPRANSQRPRELYDVHIEDGSFVRLQSLSLGYTVPPALIPQAKSARLYVEGRNLAVWTEYSGYDPEVNSFGGDATAPGVDAGAYPKARSWNFGVNLTF